MSDDSTRQTPRGDLPLTQHLYLTRNLYLTRKQSREVDRRAIDELGLPGMVLMENAGRGAADWMEQLGIAGRVLLLCGKGNNGGDGLVVARHLALRGHAVQVLLVPRPDELTGDAATNFRVIQRLGLPIVELAAEGGPAALPEALDFIVSGGASSGTQVDWLVDALLGTGASGPPRPPYDTMIEWMNAESIKRFSLDLPSGLDCDTGLPTPTTIRATATATFCSLKTGFRCEAAQEYLGQVKVMDIGLPPGWLDKQK